MDDPLDLPPQPFSFKLAAAIRAEESDEPSGDNPSLTVRNEGKGCKHPGFEIDDEARKVTCTACHRDIEPFDVLMQIALAEKRFTREYNWMVEEKRQQRGFYEAKKTVQAQRCKHRHTHLLNNGMRKCYSCDTVLDAEPHKLAQ